LGLEGRQEEALGLTNGVILEDLRQDASGDGPDPTSVAGATLRTNGREVVPFLVENVPERPRVTTELRRKIERAGLDGGAVHTALVVLVVRDDLADLGVHPVLLTKQMHRRADLSDIAQVAQAAARQPCGLRGRQNPAYPADGGKLLGVPNQQHPAGGQE